jgi:hypothetical protein
VQLTKIMQCSAVECGDGSGGRGEENDDAHSMRARSADLDVRRHFFNLCLSLLGLVVDSGNSTHGSMTLFST